MSSACTFLRRCWLASGAARASGAGRLLAADGGHALLRAVAAGADHGIGDAARRQREQHDHEA